MSSPSRQPDREPYATLAAHRAQLDRSSRSAQIADIVRASILNGEFLPRTRLSEPDICAALGVSRNTLREAFRILIEERLVTHELNRGVFVRVPTPDDVAELYKVRRVIEGAAVRDCHPTDTGLAAVGDALARAEHCAAQRDWTGVGTADIDFHKSIARLNHSARLDELMSSVWNELRLVFHVMSDPTTFHKPYLDRNRAIYDHLIAGEVVDAEKMLAAYLADAEKHILTAYNGKTANTQRPLARYTLA